jgi:gliding motility-associated-like protein
MNKLSMFHWLWLFVLFCNVSYGQLTDFVLSVSTTDETCLGNGTITFTSTETTAGATVTYYVYELPDETTPIAVQTTNFLGGRTSGTYKIVAIQTLGSEQNSQISTITINNNIVPLDYTLSSTNSVCNDGTITVTIISGVGSLYEIISGPVIKPIQTSPLFTLLPGGVYQVRVFNDCGDATVVTHTVLTETSEIIIGAVGFPESNLPTCNSINVSNVLTAGQNQTIHYPLTLNYLVHFPDGQTQTISEIVTNGGNMTEEVVTVIPFFHNQLYTFDLTVTDNCGNVFILNNNVVDLELTATLIKEIAQCDTHFLSVAAFTYSGDIYIQFTDAPVGFDPTAFNAIHPGPFPGLFSYGSFTNPVPFGHYAIQISDGCGHTATTEITLTYTPAQPFHDASPWPGCQSNYSDVTIEIPAHAITSATIITAPIAYGIPLPDDVSEFINEDDDLLLEGLITGNYTVVLTDECGNTYNYSFFVDDVSTTVSATSWPGCALGKGSIRVRGNNTTLVSAIITNAPIEFGQTLPYNVTSSISTDGIFSMGNLFPGNYTIEVIDNCGITNTAIVTVSGYQISTDNFTLTPNCGSFNLFVEHNSNAVNQFFWLQKYDSATNTWGNPVDGTIYVEGSNPNPINSYLIQNNVPVLNLTFLGTFRIIKSFQTFDDGNIASFKTCLETIKEFTFTGEIEFTGIEKTNCNGQYMDVKLFAVGVPPLIYSIIEKNGQPFFVNNGTSNQFNGLQPAIYTFKVEQSCGDSRNFISDVAELPSLANANQPNNMSACDDNSNDGIETFLLTNQNSAILGSQNASLYTITYHLSLNDAVADSNPITTNYTSGNATIYCRLEYNNSIDCFDTTSFNLIVNPYIVSQPITINLCQGESSTLSTDESFTSYQWSTGATTPSISVNQNGQYTVDVVKSYPTGNCGGQFVYNVITTIPPVIDYLEISDWTDNENTIEVVLENNNSQTYLYSIDGLHFQESPIFNNLQPGSYTVIVKDLSDCGIDSEETFLLNYPKYFTPNGDGINEYWFIKFSHVEPNMKTYIYDRFGKLITGFTAESRGWDGKLNGQLLPATDYWFVVIRESGKELRGHFTLKR